MCVFRVWEQPCRRHFRFIWLVRTKWILGRQTAALLISATTVCRSPAKPGYNLHLGLIPTDGSSRLRSHEDPFHAGREDPLQRQWQDGQAAI